MKNPEDEISSAVFSQYKYQASIAGYDIRQAAAEAVQTSVELKLQFVSENRFHSLFAKLCLNSIQSN